MYIIREVFTAKPGMASKLARMMKDVAEKEMPGKTRISTDLVGNFNTVVMETEVEDLGAFDKRMKDYGQRPDVRQMMTGYTEMYESGRREIYQVLK